MPGLTNLFDDLAVQGANSIQNIAPESNNPVTNYLRNQGQQLVQSATNTASSQVRDLTAGLTATINANAPFPSKRIMTFFLLDQTGALAKPPDGTFQPGYLFNLIINPSSLKTNLPPKTINEIRTMGGWNIQHWYGELGTLSMEGIIGNLLQRYNTDVKKTPNWDIFKKLQKVYSNNSVPYKTGAIKRQDINAQYNPTAVCVYHNVTYYGYFVNFDFDESQEQPWTRNYNFTFKFYDMIETADIVERTRLSVTNAINTTFGGAFGGVTSRINSALNPLSNI